MGKKKRPERDLGARERQILDAVYRLQPASVADVRESLEDPPSYSAVRTMLGLLESKGHLKRRRDGIRHLYVPTRSRLVAGRNAIADLMATFFDGSASKTLAALLDESSSTLTDEEFDQLQLEIEKARRGGRTDEQ